MMKMITLLFLASMSLAGVASAQDASGITTSTDPARAADVERRAQDISRQQSGASGTTSTSDTAAAAPKDQAAAKKPKKQVKKKARAKPPADSTAAP